MLYIGNYYMRYQTLYLSGSGNLCYRGTRRSYYAGNADDYVELTAGTGRSNEIADGTFGGTIRRSDASVGVAWVKYFHPQWGFKIGAGYADDVDDFDERRITASIYSRW